MDSIRISAVMEKLNKDADVVLKSEYCDSSDIHDGCARDSAFQNLISSFKDLSQISQDHTGKDTTSSNNVQDPTADLRQTIEALRVKKEQCSVDLESVKDAHSALLEKMLEKLSACLASIKDAESVFELMVSSKVYPAISISAHEARPQPNPISNSPLHSRFESSETFIPTIEASKDDVVVNLEVRVLPIKGKVSQAPWMNCSETPMIPCCPQLVEAVSLSERIQSFVRYRQAIERINEIVPKPKKPARKRS